MPPPGLFHPPNDSATYRDLLLFEERLKSNALILKRRKRRYQGMYTFPLPREKEEATLPTSARNCQSFCSSCWP